MPYDIVLRAGHVVDPVNRIDDVFDVAFDGPHIAAVGNDLGPGRLEYDCTGLHVLPGIIDPHVHLSSWLGGYQGHQMLAAAGVTTAFDVAGPVDSVMEYGASHGAGLSIACIDYVRPGHTVGSVGPGVAEIRSALHRARQSGAVGLKILGGHFPLTSEASAKVIEVCNSEGAHVAFHAGTLSVSQGMPAMREACALANGNPLHLPHINSYVRGLDEHILLEVLEAGQLLEANPNIWSESYLAPFNGASAKCSNGVPESGGATRSLVLGGFEPSEAGLRKAILAGWAHIHASREHINELATGEDGLSAWLAAETDIGVSFFVNPPEGRINLAVMRRPSGKFTVDALATDGGGIPRNDLCERGLGLVHLNAMTISDFVRKASTEFARMMGLGERKGQLGVGTDADVTVVDLGRRSAVMSFGGGKAILMRGQVIGSGSTVLAPPEALPRLNAMGLQVVAVPHGSFHATHNG